jgi:hypothetical protein
MSVLNRPRGHGTKAAPSRYAGNSGSLRSESADVEVGGTTLQFSLSDENFGPMTTELTRELFHDKVGQIWAIDESDAPPIELTLTEVEPLKNYAKLKREPFSLYFTTCGDFVLPQRLYALRHGTLGRMAIFLVPIGREGDITTYQAVFN